MKSVLLQFAQSRAPRYTSYPTANHFERGFDADVYAGWLKDLDPDQPISLYLHIPYCAKVCWYCACNMQLAARSEPVIAYAQVLRQEIAMIAKSLPARMKVADIHWGGGTPSALPIEGIAEIVGDLHEHFDILEDASHAIEIDPRTFRPEWAQQLADLGMNRASLGVQEFDPQVQETINRIQPFDVVDHVVRSLRKAGFGGINFDLMYGLPYQTIETLERTLLLTKELNPDRIALFGYAHVPWMAKNQRLIPEESLPGSAERFDQAEFAARMLEESGYRAIGLDHFAKPDDSLSKALDSGDLIRNFQGYAVGPDLPLVGMGATAVSSLPQGYTQNAPDSRSYTRLVSEGQLPIAKGVAYQGDDHIRSALIEELMCTLKVDLSALRARFDLPDDYFCDEINALSQMDRLQLLSADADRVEIPPQNRAVLRVVASYFDPYFASQAEGKTHSVAI